MMSTASLTTRIKDYGTLMKPRITLLALVTTFVGFWIAGTAFSSFTLMFTLIGTALGSSSASTLNNYVDRELDQKMSRTRERSLPSGRIEPNRALVFGILLGIGGCSVMALFVNPLSAGLLLFTILFYIFVYTIWLKRHSPYSTEIGGIAGSMPPVIGWAAATGSLGLEALTLFMIMFIWQPPHFWALGIYYLDDYKDADIPRFPVVKGIDATKWRTLLYNVILLPASVIPYTLDMVGTTYLVAASVTGLAYLAITIQFVLKPITRSAALKLFSFSNLYLLLLFIFMFVSSRSFY